ncbi:efflux RND transporter permease subunit [Candidatus Pseudothioglobus singularis]|uniref:Acriflavin resistance protein n=1 Tax=Candidatus Pseudothioglobus singularis PS1 TaxID=1125411 RepID=A0A0M4LDF8_9GAMM|nr:efflux RND transporter permease subunit [Candidatus Pseudothioglobus singularis]ALE01944.1 acriflavin resistance protein [Candidatus Pseudothioglobus singularis PS1]
MNAFLNFLVRQKKLALLFTLSIVILGFMTLQKIQRDTYPVIEFDRLSINTSYPSASPRDVEKNITNVIENKIKGIYGIKELTSTSSEGSSRINIEIDEEVDDIQEVKDSISEAVNEIEDLPEDANDPRVVDRTSTEWPILTIVIGGDSINVETAKAIANNIEKNLSLIDGVSSVNVSGDSEREVQIRINPEKLFQYQLSFDQVRSVIADQNVRSAIGDNNQGRNQKNIVIISEYETMESLENVVVKSSFDGPTILLKDIATIDEGEIGFNTVTRINGTKGYILKVTKTEKADVIRTIEKVRATLDTLKESYPSNLNLIVTDDRSKPVSNRLNIVMNNALVGLALIMVVLGLFLSLKTAFWVAVSIPVTLLGTVAFLGFAGETINLISTIGMVLVLGLVVDDSIIIAESIHHFKEKGGDVYQNIVDGLKRVIMPVITTILTTVLAISTVLLVSGTTGKFIYILPITVICALTFSLLEVSIALPAHMSGSEANKQKTWFKPVERWFEKALLVILRWRFIILSLFIALLAFSAYIGTKEISYIQWPSSGTNSINIRVQTPLGTPVETTEQSIIKIDEIIMDKVGSNLDFFTSTIGSRGSNRAAIAITLIPANDREVTAKEIIEILKAETEGIEGVSRINFRTNRGGPRGALDIELSLIGSNDEQRQAAVDQLEMILNSFEGVSDIDRDDDLSKNRIEVLLDYESMARLGIQYQQVYSHLRTIYSGMDVSDVEFNNTSLNVKMYLGDSNYSDDYITKTSIRNNQGRMIPMSQFANVIETPGDPNYKHLNGERVVKVSAAVEDSVTTAQSVSKRALDELDLINNFPEVRVIEGGSSLEAKEALSDFSLALGFAVFGIYMLISLLFNSYSQPLLVILSIPFALIGVVWAFFFHSETFSFFVLLGVLALVGVVVNDSLVMISHLNFIKKNKDMDGSSIEWIAKGAKDRLRAVILTTLTTLAGVLPLIYGFGGKDAFLQPMVMALGYGLLFGTFVTLILLPCLYSINLDVSNWFSRLKTRFL